MSERHRWHASVMRLAPDMSADGNPRNVRSCMRCGMQRVTVLPAYGYPWVEWVTPDGATLRQEHTPPCIATQAAEAA